jgi:hypothetical protein
MVIAALGSELQLPNAISGLTQLALGYAPDIIV